MSQALLIDTETLQGSLGREDLVVIDVADEERIGERLPRRKGLPLRFESRQGARNIIWPSAQ